MKIIDRQEVELAYYSVTVQHISLKSMVTWNFLIDCNIIDVSMT